MINLVRPEDILPDGVEGVTIKGKDIRKGTIAAFLANVELLEQQNLTSQQRQSAVDVMKELAPGVVAIGLHHHVVFKNPIVEQILIDAKRMA